MTALMPRWILLSLFSIIPLTAQTPSASVVGRITDASGAVVPGVAITVTNTDTNQSRHGVSNGAGDYTIPYLDPGRYTLEAEGRGFNLYKHAGFKLEVDREQRLDIKLDVGATN